MDRDLLLELALESWYLSRFGALPRLLPCPSSPPLALSSPHSSGEPRSPGGGPSGSAGLVNRVPTARNWPAPAPSRPFAAAKAANFSPISPLVVVGEAWESGGKARLEPKWHRRAVWKHFDKYASAQYQSCPPASAAQKVITQSSPPAQTVYLYYKIKPPMVHIAAGLRSMQLPPQHRRLDFNRK